MSSLKRLCTVLLGWSFLSWLVVDLRVTSRVSGDRLSAHFHVTRDARFCCDCNFLVVPDSQLPDLIEIFFAESLRKISVSPLFSGRRGTVHWLCFRDSVEFSGDVCRYFLKSWGGCGLGQRFSSTVANDLAQLHRYVLLFALLRHEESYFARITCSRLQEHPLLQRSLRPITLRKFVAFSCTHKKELAGISSILSFWNCSGGDVILSLLAHTYYISPLSYHIFLFLWPTKILLVFWLMS